MSMSLRIASSFMGGVFLFCVVVQYNDPDPVRWMAIYGAAAVACLLAVLRRTSAVLPAGVGLVALVWAGIWAPGALGQLAPPELFESWGMQTLAVEEGREMLGLLLVAIWMGVLAVSVRAPAPAAGHARPAAH